MFLMAFNCFQEKIRDAFTGERDNQNLNIKYEIISQSKSPKDKVSSYIVVDIHKLKKYQYCGVPRTFKMIFWLLSK